MAGTFNTMPTIFSDNTLAALTEVPMQPEELGFLSAILQLPYRGPEIDQNADSAYGTLSEHMQFGIDSRNDLAYGTHQRSEDQTMASDEIFAMPDAHGSITREQMPSSSWSFDLADTVGDVSAHDAERVYDYSKTPKDHRMS